MTEPAVKPAKPRKRVQDRWWWPPFVVTCIVMSIGGVHATPEITTGIVGSWFDWVDVGLDWVGAVLEWAQEVTCTGDKC